MGKFSYTSRGESVTRGRLRRWLARAGVSALLIAAILGAATSAQAATLSPGDIIICATFDDAGTLRRGLLRVDPVNGNREVISSSGAGGVGTGPQFDQPSGVKFLSDGSIAFVNRWSADLPLGIIRVDPSTGNREYITAWELSPSGPVVGDGAFLSEVIGLHEEPSARILLVDGGDSKLVGVDPVTGDRTVISSDTVGSGPEFGNFPIDVIVTSSGAVFVTGFFSEAVYAVDTATGNRTIVSGAGVGSGPEFGRLTAFAPADGGNLYIGSADGPDAPDGSGVYHVDLTSGLRTIISSDNVGTGPIFGTAASPGGLAIEANGQLVATGIFSADGGPTDRGVIRVDPLTGNRTIVSSNAVGLGPSLTIVTGIAVVPVPEPGTIALAGCALLVFALWGIRLRRT